MATEIVNATQSFSSALYIIILVTVILLALIIFFNRKMNYDLKKTFKSIWISILITLGLQILLTLIGSFFMGIQCKEGSPCPSNFEMSLGFFPYTFPAILLIVIFLYYLINFARNKTN
jgi:hypothetical protein